jgi:hypothetical protein
MAALHQKQGRSAVAEGLYRKAASKCKDHLQQNKNDFRSVIAYGQTLLNVAIAAVATNGHKLAEADLQHALKVIWHCEPLRHPCTHVLQVWEKASSRFGSRHHSAICDGVSSALALIADAREKTGDLVSAERVMGQALLQAKSSKSAHSVKALPSLYSNLARIQLASGDTVRASTTIQVCSFGYS